MKKLITGKAKLLALLAATLVLAGVGTTTLLAEERDNGLAPVDSEQAEPVGEVDYSQFQVAPEKRPNNPDAGLTDEQRMKRIEAGRAMQRNFATGFIPNGGDPRALQRMTIDTYGSPHTTFELAVERAHVILVGRVAAVEYRGEDSHGSAHSVATVAVSGVLKGSEPITTIEVRQTGGPMLTSEGPALVQLSSSELLLPGDQVLLMLIEVEGLKLPLSGTGVIFFEDGVARTEASSPFKDHLEGQSLQAVVSQIRTLAKP